jgi:hypothetical protein
MIKASLHALEVKAKLLAMSEQARKKAFRKVLRQAARPVATELQRSWARAKRRGGLVTGEIADAQESRIKFRKRTGQATLEIGTNYKRGGYAKIWHILENGFKHYGNSSTYTTMGDEANSLKRRREVFREEVAKGLGGYKGKSKDERIALAKASTAAWQAKMPGADSAIGRAKSAKSARRDAARAKGANRTILGRKISRPIAAKWAPKLAQIAKDLLVAEIMKPVKKKGGKK